MNDDRHNGSEQRRDYGDLLREGEGLLQERLLKYQELDYTYKGWEFTGDEEQE